MSRRRGLIVVAGLAALAALVWFSGAVQWTREPPYRLVQSFGGAGTEDGRFNEPTGIAVDGGEVYVSDARNARIQVFDRQGRYRRQFGAPQLGRPMNLALHGDAVYVADFFADRIQVYDRQGHFLRALGASLELRNPGGVAVRADGRLLIADTYNHRIVEASPDGTLLRQWGGSKGYGAGAFNYPTDIALAADGGFYVADGYNDRIQQFDADGAYSRRWGGPFGLNIFGPFKGWFATVTSIAVGPDGSVYAADFYNDRVQKFCERGGFLNAIAIADGGPTHSAIAVAVDAAGELWVANYAKNRIEHWRAGG